MVDLVRLRRDATALNVELGERAHACLVYQAIVRADQRVPFSAVLDTCAKLAPTFSDRDSKSEAAAA